MALRPQDAVVALKLVALGEDKWTYNGRADQLSMSPSEVHAAVHRAKASALLHPETHVPLRPNLLELLVHELKYVFPVERGPVTRGVPTAQLSALPGRICSCPFQKAVRRLAESPAPTVEGKTKDPVP